MVRTVPHQPAALDILDWLYFNQTLVFCVYEEQEWEWLRRLVEGVRAAVAHIGATGLHAECLKHAVLCLMEISLHDPLDRMPTPEPIPMPPGITPEIRAKLDAYTRDFFMAMVIAVGEQARQAPIDAAIGIANGLLSEFGTAPATIRYRLVERCLAFEYMLAPLEFFSWLLELGMIHSKKCVPGRASASSNDNTITRIGLLCEFETIRIAMIAQRKQQKDVEGLLKLSDRLSSNAVEQLLDNMRHYQGLAHARSHSMIAFDPERIRDAAYARQFLLNYGRNCFRTRMVPGTQGKWLGMLGAAMVSIRKTLVSPDKPIYVENSNVDSNTDRVAAMLLEWGCTILPRTLYESYREFVEEIRVRVGTYYAAQVQAGAAPPGDWQDLFYYGTIVVTLE